MKISVVLVGLALVCLFAIGAWGISPAGAPELRTRKVVVVEQTPAGDQEAPGASGLDGIALWERDTYALAVANAAANEAAAIAERDARLAELQAQQAELTQQGEQLKQIEQVAATIAADGSSPWDWQASCETGGNWQMQGSSYSGGLGFANGSWNAYGGQEFASNAGLATREQQIVVAERIQSAPPAVGWAADGGCRGGW